MRHRLTVALYDDNDLDAEILDFLSDLNKGRQENLRTLLRAGFSVIVNQTSMEEARLSTLDEETIRSLAANALNINPKGSLFKKSPVTKREVVKEPHVEKQTVNDDLKANDKVVVTETQESPPNTEINTDIINHEEIIKENDSKEEFKKELNEDDIFNPLAKLQNINSKNR